MACALLTERRDHTLVLTLSDPATRNALSPEVYAAGIEALNTAESDPSLRCVVLRGDGGHFCSGGDLRRLARNRAAGPQEQRQSIERLHGLVEALRASPKPVIAAVEGAAAGAGCSLALACDLIVAAEGARFTMSYGRIGLSPDGGGSWHLGQALPRGLALQLLWLPEPLEAHRLQQWGLVQFVTGNGEAFAEALRVAERLGAMAPNAVASAKDLVNQARQRPLREHLDAERDHFVDNLFHANGGEGLQAFFDKRPPRFGP